jgi:hypothetical protein
VTLSDPDSFSADDRPSPQAWAELFAFYAGSSLLTVAAHFADVARACSGDLVYLATPYSVEVVDGQGRFDISMSAAMAEVAAAWSLRCAAAGITALSPIAMSHAMVAADAYDQIDPLAAPFWTAWCRPMLAACPVVLVPPISGWDRSVGIWHEVRAHLARQRRVYLIAPRGHPASDVFARSLAGMEV